MEKVCLLGLTQFFYESAYITRRWRGLKPRQRRGCVSSIYVFARKSLVCVQLAENVACNNGAGDKNGNAAKS